MHISDRTLMYVLASLLALIILSPLGQVSAVHAQTTPASPTWFKFLGEFVDSEVGYYATTFPWFTGYGLWPSTSDTTLLTLQNTQLDFMLYYPASVSVAQNFYNGGLTRITPSLTAIQTEESKLKSLTGTIGSRAWWDVMPEWDGEGGYWIKPANTPFTATTKTGMYTNFKNYYSTMSPLGNYLRTTRDVRGFNMAAVTDWTSNVHYAYEWGLDLVLLERAIDELGDIATGVAFVRGAGSQYNKPWGIDMSFWRTSANSATEFNSSGQQIGGFSDSYFKRHSYLSYMSGANMLHYEPVVYLKTGGGVNPIGSMAQEFADFTKRHPARGQAHVPFALLLDFYHGYNPKHWLYRPDASWYYRIPYKAGDFMLTNIFNTLYPGHGNHGLTIPGWSWDSFEAFHQWIVAGNDPRPYEPMPNSRFGDMFDVLLSNASLTVLNKYKVITLAGDVVINATLGGTLNQWVNGGGTLVVSSGQATDTDATLLGVTFNNNIRQSFSSRWLNTATRYDESVYSYSLITPTTAVVLARNDEGDPIITRNKVGNGYVYFVSAAYMQDDGHTNLLNIGIRLIDELAQVHRLSWVEGAPVDYLTTQDSSGVTVTVANNSSNTWQGAVHVKRGSPTRVTEWLTDLDVPYTYANGVATLSGNVPPYDVRVFSVLGASTDATPPQAPILKGVTVP